MGWGPLLVPTYPENFKDLLTRGESSSLASPPQFTLICTLLVSQPMRRQRVTSMYNDNYNNNHHHHHSGAPWVNKSTHPRKCGNHVTDRATDRPSAPQAYQCLLSHFLVTLGAQEKADCTSIDSCQKRVSADQYHLTVSRAQVSTHQGRVFLWSYPLTIYQFSNDRRLTFILF